MDYPNKEGSLLKTQNHYSRRTPVTRSIKQNGEFLFSNQRRREPITPYVPPYRRKDSIEDGSLLGSLPSRSEAKEKTPVRVVHQKSILQFNEDNFSDEFDERRLITQDFNRKSVEMQQINTSSQVTEEFNRKSIESQQINTNSLITQEIDREYTGSQQINTNSVMAQETNEERVIQQFNEESIAEECNNENFRQNSRENANLEINEEKLKRTQDFNQSFKQNVSNENVSQEKNQQSIAEKVLKLSQHYMNTVYKSMLCKMYFDKYKEKLPTEYLSAIKFCIQLDFNDSLDDLLNTKSLNEQINQERRFLDNEKECRSENSLLCHTEINQPKELELKDIDKEFWIIIYNCESFINIWGVLMDADHFGKVEELSNQMKDYFQYERRLLNGKVEENSYYALFDGSWYRVQCIKCNESTAEVFFIDRGDRDNVPIEKLHNLDPKFFTLPAQAINMSLSNLDIFTNCDGAPEMLDELLFDKVFYAVVKSSNEEKPYLSVELHQSEENNKTTNVNELLMRKLFETILNPLYSIRKDNPEHIEFIQINETGMFIQFNTTSSKYFKLLMDDLIKKYWSNENLEKQKIVRFEGNKIYLVKRSRDKKFYRAKVTKFTTEQTIEVLLIDSGIVTIINRDNFFALEKLSPVLVEYPAQAIEIQLDQITVLHPKILDHLHSLTSNSNKLYVKFSKIELENNNALIIRLYKKINGYLISVNDAILIEHNDILQNQLGTSESTPKSTEDNFGESKLESVDGNFCDSKSKLAEENIGESKLKLAESYFTENNPKSPEGNFCENAQKSAENSVDEGNCGENKRKSVEKCFVERKKISAKGNFNKNKQSSEESSVFESKSTSTTGNFIESQPKLTKNNFNENKQKPIENNFIIEQKSPEKNYDDLFKNNLLNSLDRLKLYEAELSRPVETVDCTKLCLSGLLNPPTLSKSKLFDVHVTAVKDPSYFAFQLLKNRSVELKRMEREMRGVYVNYTGPKITHRSLGIGKIYAYRCELNPQIWYRVYLLKIQDKNVATVYYCDYGWYKDINIENLLYLQRQFYALPYQAIWAELYGVKPLSNHFWTSEVCTRFKELIESKNFVCEVKDVRDVKLLNRNKSMPVTLEYIYSVKLIDTSTDEDLYIGNTLIEERCALKKSSNRNVLK